MARLFKVLYLFKVHFQVFIGENSCSGSAIAMCCHYPLNTTPTKKCLPLIGCLAVYFSLIPVQLINSTVIREFLPCN